MLWRIDSETRQTWDGILFSLLTSLGMSLCFSDRSFFIYKTQIIIPLIGMLWRLN